MKADRAHYSLMCRIITGHMRRLAIYLDEGLVEGYPDGTFGGDRMLTRYEFAQIVYRAIQNALSSMIDSYLNLVLKWRYSVWILLPRIMKDNQLLNV